MVKKMSLPLPPSRSGNPFTSVPAAAAANTIGLADIPLDVHRHLVGYIGLRFPSRDLTSFSAVNKNFYRLSEAPRAERMLEVRTLQLKGACRNNQLVPQSLRKMNDALERLQNCGDSRFPRRAHQLLGEALDLSKSLEHLVWRGDKPGVRYFQLVLNGYQQLDASYLHNWQNGATFRKLIAIPVSAKAKGQWADRVLQQSEDIPDPFRGNVLSDFAAAAAGTELLHKLLGRGEGLPVSSAVDSAIFLDRLGLTSTVEDREVLRHIATNLVRSCSFEASNDVWFPIKALVNFYGNRVACDANAKLVAFEHVWNMVTTTLTRTPSAAQLVSDQNQSNGSLHPEPSTRAWDSLFTSATEVYARMVVLAAQCEEPHRVRLLAKLAGLEIGRENDRMEALVWQGTKGFEAHLQVARIVCGRGATLTDTTADLLFRLDQDQIHNNTGFDKQLASCVFLAPRSRRLDFVEKFCVSNGNSAAALVLLAQAWAASDAAKLPIEDDISQQDIVNYLLQQASRHHDTHVVEQVRLALSANSAHRGKLVQRALLSSRKDGNGD